MSRKKFIFYRSVSDKNSTELHDATRQVVKNMDFIHPIQPANLHMTILSWKMLSKEPVGFISNYSSYDVNRKKFDFGNVSSWENVEVNVKEVRVVKNVLSIFLDKPEWVGRERNAIRRVSNIREDHISFRNSEYNPHISLGKFVGSIKDFDGLDEAESELSTALRGVKAVILSPLRFKGNNNNWEFQPRQLSPSDSLAAEFLD